MAKVSRRTLIKVTGAIGSSVLPAGLGSGTTLAQGASPSVGARGPASGSAGTNSQKIVKEIENLQQGVDTISARLSSLKEKAQRGEKINADELDITVTDIDRLDAMMRERRDVGH